MSRIILNSIRTPDGTVISSYYTHQYVEHRDANGKIYAVDGGTSYLRRSYEIADHEDLSISIEDNELDAKFDVVRENLRWGTRGRNGDKPLTWVSLKEMSDDHLDAMLRKYNGPIDEFYKKCFYKEEAYRVENKIKVEEK